MSVIYTKSDGIGRKIVPAPVVSVNKTYDTTQDGKKIGSKYSLTLTGTLLPFRGSPSGSYTALSGAFHTTGGYPADETYAANNEDFNHILRKQEALRWLFSDDGGILEWQPSNGQPPVKCYPRILSINFSEGQWADRCDYTIQLEAPWIYINGTLDVEDSVATDLVNGSSETWSFEEATGRNDKQYRVTHDVSADGKLEYDGLGNPYGNKQAWENAKTFVDAKISGFVDSNTMFAALGASGKITGHYSTVTRIDEDAGSYNVTEEWLLSDSAAYEERQFTVDYNQSQDEYTITYQGTIYGVGTDSRAGADSNITAAKAAIPSISAARTTAISYVSSLIGGKTIPSSPDKKTFNINKQDGTVNFTYIWNTSDDTDVLITEEGQLTYSLDNQSNTLVFTQTVEGKGDTAAEKLTNAKAAIYTNAEALVAAKTLVGTSLSFDLGSVLKSFNSRDGSARASWTWNDIDSNNTDITIQTQMAVDVIASIAIPGRSAGPIIQNMGTKNSEIITVSIRSTRNTSKPTVDTTAYGDGGTIVDDSDNWNPITGVYSRTTRFLKET